MKYRNTVFAGEERYGWKATLIWLLALLCVVLVMANNAKEIHEAIRSQGPSPEQISVRDM
jgi:uncharacterized membrane protein YdfJ with MMPL/SSD domain